MERNVRDTLFCMPHKRVRRPRPIAFSELEREDSRSGEARNPIDSIEFNAARRDPQLSAQARRWMPGECQPDPPKRGLYEWIGTESRIFRDVPKGERRICAEWLRGVRQPIIAKRCKIGLRTVRRIVAGFKQHLKGLSARGLIMQTDLEEYISLLGGNVSSMIARMKHAPPRRDTPYAVLDPVRPVARVIADHLPDDVFAERCARHEAALRRLERDRHCVSVIGLPALVHRGVFRRRPKSR